MGEGYHGMMYSFFLSNYHFIVLDGIVLFNARVIHFYLIYDDIKLRVKDNNN